MAIRAIHNWNVLAERRFAPAGDIPVYYEERGAGDPLILIHGLSASGRWWTRNISALAEHHRVYVVDLAGFGRSRAAQRPALGETGAFLERWMDSLNIERASLVGHSMGGAIAARLAADFPARVDRLVLVNAAALPLSRSGMVLRFGLGGVFRSVSPAFLPVVVADGWRAGPVSVIGAARDLLQADIRAKLSQIEAPTLVIWGERDRILPLALGEQLSTAIPDARLHVIRGAGHNPMWDRSAEFNEAALDFLAQKPLIRGVV